ncbi:MAG: universal stress protein [Chloroflexi bacterium]|nr:universal stress protein [Chloroflexota bacterium]
MFKILLAVDGSNFAQEAVDFAAELSRRMGDAQIILFYVIEPPSLPLVAGPMEVGVPVAWPQPEEQEQAARQVLGAANERLKAAGQTGIMRFSRGRTADVICDIAAKESFDLIIMGSRGMGHLSGMLLGSVSDRVLHRSTVPVLVVRRPSAKSPQKN